MSSAFTDDMQANGTSNACYPPDAGLLPASGFLSPWYYPTQFITLTDVVLVLPAASRAVTAMVWVPLLDLRVFQL